MGSCTSKPVAVTPAPTQVPKKDDKQAQATPVQQGGKPAQAPAKDSFDKGGKTQGGCATPAKPC